MNKKAILFGILTSFIVGFLFIILSSFLSSKKNKDIKEKNNVSVVQNVDNSELKEKEVKEMTQEEKIQMIIEKNKNNQTPVNLKITPITNNQTNTVVILLDDTLKKDTYGKLRIYSNTYLEYVKPATKNISMKCNLEKQLVVCNVLTLQDITGPFFKVKYKDRGKDESNILDFTSSDPQLSFSFGVISTDINGVFKVGNIEEVLLPGNKQKKDTTIQKE